MDSRTKKVYLGKARHNLKNPVNAILGYSEMLIEDCEDNGLTNVIKDLEKLYFAGKDILTAIENNFSDQSLNLGDKNISEIGKRTELDIRTPLNTIIGYSELIIEKPITGDIGNEIRIKSLILGKIYILKMGPSLIKNMFLQKLIKL